MCLIGEQEDLAGHCNALAQCRLIKSTVTLGMESGRASCTDTLISQRYVDNILRAIVVPFGQCIGGNFEYQDNKIPPH